MMNRSYCLFKQSVAPDEHYQSLTGDNPELITQSPGGSSIHIKAGSIVSMFYVAVDSCHCRFIVPAIDGVILRRLATILPPEQFLATVEALERGMEMIGK